MKTAIILLATIVLFGATMMTQNIVYADSKSNTTQTSNKTQTAKPLTVKKHSAKTPDYSCLFNSEQEKCKANPITLQCPSGFFTNGYDECVPNHTKCPKGFEIGPEGDETGQCYPISKPTTTTITAKKPICPIPKNI